MGRSVRRAAVLLGAVVLVACGEVGAPDASGAGVPAWEVWADAVALPNDELDGWIDVEYRHSSTDPAYAEGTGPIVCIDKAHFNYHTAAGIYWPFARLLRDDGIRVSRFRFTFDTGALSDCQILVIANAQAPDNTIGFGSPSSHWAYPHGTALTSAEIVALISWVERGGALLLIADHAPLPAAVSDLALLLGVHMLDGDALAGERERTDSIVFGTVDEDVWRASDEQLRAAAGVQLLRRYRGVPASPGAWADHPIVEGRDSDERVEWIVAFGGQAFLASDDWRPISVFGPGAVGLIPLNLNFEADEWGDGPLISIEGWLHGATRLLGDGRVAVLGEGGMCTAQFDDLDGELVGPVLPYGFNASYAPQNAQFCLNVVHWLAGLIQE